MGTPVTPVQASGAYASPAARPYVRQHATPYAVPFQTPAGGGAAAQPQLFPSKRKQSTGGGAADVGRSGFRAGDWRSGAMPTVPDVAPQQQQQPAASSSRPRALKRMASSSGMGRARGAPS